MTYFRKGCLFLKGVFNNGALINGSCLNIFIVIRRFLDDYYSKYNTRVSQSQEPVGRSGIESTERMDNYAYESIENLYEDEARDMPGNYLTLRQNKIIILINKNFF